MAQFIQYNPVTPVDNTSSYAQAYGGLQNSLNNLGANLGNAGNVIQNNRNKILDNNFRLAQAQVKDDPNALRSLTQDYINNGFGYALSDPTLSEANRAKNEGLDLRNSQWSSDIAHQTAAQQQNLNNAEIQAQQLERNGNIAGAFRLRTQANLDNPIGYQYGTRPSSSSGNAQNRSSVGQTQGSNSSYDVNQGVQGVNDNTSGQIYNAKLDPSKMSDADQQGLSFLQTNRAQLLDDIANSGAYGSGQLGDITNLLVNYGKSHNIAISPQIAQAYAGELVKGLNIPGASTNYWSQDYADQVKNQPNNKLFGTKAYNLFTQGGIMTEPGRTAYNTDITTRLDNERASLQGSPEGQIVSQGAQPISADTYQANGLDIDPKNIPATNTTLNRLRLRIQQNNPSAFKGLTQNEANAAILQAIGTNSAQSGSIKQILLNRDNTALNSLNVADWWSKNGIFDPSQIDPKTIVNARNKFKVISNTEDLLKKQNDNIDNISKGFGANGLTYPNAVRTPAQKAAYIKQQIAPGLNYGLANFNNIDKNINDNLDQLHNESQIGADEAKQDQINQQDQQAAQQANTNRQQTEANQKNALTDWNNTNSNIRSIMMQDPKNLSDTDLDNFISQGRLLKPQLNTKNASPQDINLFNRSLRAARQEQLARTNATNAEQYNTYSNFAQQLGLVPQASLGKASPETSARPLNSINIEPQDLINISNQINSSNLSDKQKQTLHNRIEKLYQNNIKF